MVVLFVITFVLVNEGFVIIWNAYDYLEAENEVTICYTTVFPYEGDQNRKKINNSIWGLLFCQQICKVSRKNVLSCHFSNSIFLKVKIEGFTGIWYNSTKRGFITISISYEMRQNVDNHNQ